MLPRAVAVGLLCLAAVLLGPGATARAAAATPRVRPSPPKILPEVRVSTDVPLEKVGEFHLVEKRSASAVVAHGDYIYTLGGEQNGRLLDTIERLNVRTGKAEAFGRLKSPRRWHRAVVAGERIYVLGGYSSTNPEIGPTPAVEIVDPVTGQIATGPKMPGGRANFACVAMGGKIYVAGGVLLKGNYVARELTAEDGGATEVQQRTLLFGRTNTMAVLDLATQRWSDGTPMPAPAEVTGTVVTGPFLVIAGGFSKAGKVVNDDGSYGDARALSEVFSFNPRDGKWRTQAPLHRPSGEHSLVFLGHYLFLFGNHAEEQELIAYDLMARASESFTLGYQAAQHNGAVAHEDRIYVVGGVGANGLAIDTVQVFALRKRAQRIESNESKRGS